MGHRRFVTTTLLICFAGYLALGFFGHSYAFCATTKNFADTSPCYKFAVRGQHAEILLVGDSSLLYGINPKIVTRLTNRSIYNYGVVGPVFSFDPSAVIDHYMNTNQRPRAIIAYVSPWDVVEPHRIRDPVWFPIGLAAMQHPNVIPLQSVVRARPSSVVEFPQILATSISLAPGSSAATRAQMDNDFGFSDFAGQLPPKDVRLTKCDRSTGEARPPDLGPSRATFDRLRARYAARGIAFYVYVAPFARCGAAVAALSHAYSGIAENEPTAMDDSLFANEKENGGNVHVNQAGVGAASGLLANFILAHQIGAER